MLREAVVAEEEEPWRWQVVRQPRRTEKADAEPEVPLEVWERERE